MTITNTDTFTVTRDEIINASLRLLGVIGTGETAGTEDYTNCSQALNIMIKSWAKKGFPLWVTQELSIPMITGINPYPLGPTAGYLTSESIVINNAGSGGIDGTYALSITDAGGGTGAAGTYVISGGVLTTVTITAAGSSYVTPVVTFPSGSITGVSVTTSVVGVTCPRPLRIVDAYIRDTSSNDTPMILISRQEYDILGDKSSQGVPNQFYYDDQLTTGQLYVYNVPAQNGYVMYAQIQRMFFDMTTGTNNFDFPQEWFQALKWGLACEILAEYGVSLQMIPYFEQKATMYIEECFNWSQEEAGVFFTPNSQGTIQRGQY